MVRLESRVAACEHRNRLARSVAAPVQGFGADVVHRNGAAAVGAAQAPDCDGAGLVEIVIETSMVAPVSLDVGIEIDAALGLVAEAVAEDRTGQHLQKNTNIYIIE